MDAKDYLFYIVNEIHSTIVAMVDDDGLPVICAIDMMDCDSDSLYFLTAKGKSFYNRLVRLVPKNCRNCSIKTRT